jgi:nicotinate phosphoribosyltransferase
MGRHPFLEFEKKFYDRITSAEPMLMPVMTDGKIVAKFPSLEDIRKNARKGLETLHPTNKRLLNPHIYKVSLGPKLAEETQRLRNLPL